MSSLKWSGSSSSRHHRGDDEENAERDMFLPDENYHGITSGVTRQPKEKKRNMFFSMAILVSSLLFCALLAMTYLSRTVQEADRSTKTGVFEEIGGSTSETPIMTSTEFNPVGTLLDTSTTPVMTMNGDDGTGLYDATSYTSSSNSIISEAVNGGDPMMSNDPLMTSAGIDGPIMQAPPVAADTVAAAVAASLSKAAETPIETETTTTLSTSSSTESTTADAVSDIVTTKETVAATPTTTTTSTAADATAAVTAAEPAATSSTESKSEGSATTAVPAAAASDAVKSVAVEATTAATVPAATVTATTVPAATVTAATVTATTVPAATVTAATVPAATVTAATVTATTVPAATVTAATVTAATVPAATVTATTVPAATVTAATVTAVAPTTAAAPVATVTTTDSAAEVPAAVEKTDVASAAASMTVEAPAAVSDEPTETKATTTTELATAEPAAATTTTTKAAVATTETAASPVSVAASTATDATTKETAVDATVAATATTADTGATTAIGTTAAAAVMESTVSTPAAADTTVTTVAADTADTVEAAGTVEGSVKEGVLMTSTQEEESSATESSATESSATEGTVTEAEGAEAEGAESAEGVETEGAVVDGGEADGAEMKGAEETAEMEVEVEVEAEEAPTEEPTESPTETPTETPTEAPVAPNIIFILADDLGFSSIGYKEEFRGYHEYDLSFATPVMTAMAQKGLIMSNYYAQEVCTPSRAALLTGRYPLSSGMQYGVIDTRVPWGLDLSEQTLAEVLRDAGYKTHALGKWHLGHHTPKYLPTARGFQSFVGFLNGDSYYYSKINPLEHTYVDLLRMDSKCYFPYTDSDLFDYSTTLYQNKAVEIIVNHDQTSPLFLYMPFQAVHDPFDDVASFYDAKDAVPADIKDLIKTYIKGNKRTEYVYALYLMDQAVGSITEALESSGMMDNTYIIFASDNGGCNSAGGKVAPYRGTKGSLFEGGTHVDAFVYSPLLAPELVGKAHDKLMHVTDWFPTILEIAGVEHEPRAGYDLDGVSQFKSWTTGTAARTVMLYNSAYNVKERDFQYTTNSAFAIRTERFKLMHYFNSTYYAGWYDSETVSEDDEGSNESECSATSSYVFLGDYTKALFDLQNDPYEQVNLYDSTRGGISVVKSQLYSLIDYYNMRSRTDLVKSVKALDAATLAWDSANGYIVPFQEDEGEDAETVFSSSYPSFCEPKLGGKSSVGGVTLSRR